MAWRITFQYCTNSFVYCEYLSQTTLMLFTSSWAAAGGSYLHSHRMLTPCTSANSYAKHVGCFWWVGLSILASSLHNKSRKPVRNTGFIIGRQTDRSIGQHSFPSQHCDKTSMSEKSSLLVRYLPLYSWACKPSTCIRSHRLQWKNQSVQLP